MSPCISALSHFYHKTDCNTLSAQIAATDKEIDCMVYELYGLTDDEIKVVEG